MDRETRWILLLTQIKVCTYCDSKTSESYHIDYFDPLTKGGEPIWTNIVVACAECYVAKGSMKGLEYIDLVRLNKFLEFCESQFDTE